MTSAKEKCTKVMSTVKAVVDPNAKAHLKQLASDLLSEAEKLAQMKVDIQELAKNPFQPPPKIIEVDAMVTREKVNPELQPNEV